jgi:hypothetical protein
VAHGASVWNYFNAAGNRTVCDAGMAVILAGIVPCPAPDRAGSGLLVSLFTFHVSRFPAIDWRRQALYDINAVPLPRENS